MAGVPYFPHQLPLVEPVPTTPWGPSPEYADMPYRAGEILLGHIVRQHFWGSKAQELEDFKELRRKDKLREQLGGFGFRSGV